jgi:hypothetical protein
MIEALEYAWENKPLDKTDRRHVRFELYRVHPIVYPFVMLFLKKYKGGKYDLSE